MEPSRLYDRSRALIELAAAHAHRGREGVEPACSHLSSAVALAGRAGLVSHVERMWAVRERLEAWSDTTEAGPARCSQEPGVERITIDPSRMRGRPCIRDTRVTVSAVLGQLAAGQTVAQVLADYPYLEIEDILVALSFAAEAFIVSEIALCPSVPLLDPTMDTLSQQRRGTTKPQS